MLYVNKKLNDLIIVDFTEYGYDRYKKIVNGEDISFESRLKEGDIIINSIFGRYGQRITLTYLYALFGEDFLLNSDKYIENGLFKYEVTTII